MVYNLNNQYLKQSTGRNNLHCQEQKESNLVVFKPFITRSNIFKTESFYGCRDHLIYHLPFKILASEVQSEWRYYFSNRAHFWPADTIIASLARFVPGSTQFLQHLLSSKKQQKRRKYDAMYQALGLYRFDLKPNFNICTHTC